MNRSPSELRAGGSSRPWHIPPPLVHGPSPLEAGAVLDEVEGQLGVLLWQLTRDLLLWTQSAPADRTVLFAPEAAARRARLVSSAHLPTELRGPVETLSSLLGSAGGPERSVVAEACRSVSRWAEGRGAVATALAFAQNRALVTADSPAAALAVARLAERLGDHARAELWYRRATGIARRSRAWRAYSRSFSGLGRLYQRRGNLPAARRFHLRALRGARRGGLGEERGLTLHDLFGVEVEAGRPDEARQYALAALAAYPRHSPRIAALAHDVAYFWMEQGEFASAATVFRAVLPLVHRPRERLWVEADLMRAEAGSGSEAAASALAERVTAAVSQPDLAPAAARALLEIARGQLQLRQWEAAQATATAALEAAHAHREGRIAFAAEALLEAITSAQAVGWRAPTEQGGTPVPAGDHALVEGLVHSLAELNTLAGAQKRTELTPEILVYTLPQADSSRP